MAGRQVLLCLLLLENRFGIDGDPDLVAREENDIHRRPADLSVARLDCREPVASQAALASAAGWIVRHQAAGAELTP